MYVIHLTLFSSRKFTNLLYFNEPLRESKRAAEVVLFFFQVVISPVLLTESGGGGEDA